MSRATPPSPFAPCVSPLAAMQQAGLTYTDIADRTGYGVAHIRNVMRAKEAQNRGEDVRRDQTANPTTARRIAHAIGDTCDEMSFYRLPERGQGVPRRTANGKRPSSARRLQSAARNTEATTTKGQKG